MSDEKKVQTTVRVQKELLIKVRQKLLGQGKSLTGIVEKFLEEYVKAPD